MKKLKSAASMLFFLYDDFEDVEDIEKINFANCKKYTGSQVFLTRGSTLKNPLKRQNCPLVAAKLPKVIEEHTEAIIFNNAKFCPKKTKAYLYSYFSPCVSCDNIIKNHVLDCAGDVTQGPYDLIIGYSKAYRDIKESEKAIKEMKKHVVMTMI